MRELTLETTRRTEFVEITEQVLEALGDPGDAAAVLIYVPHVTAGVVVQEPRDDDTVAADLAMAFDRIVDDGWPFTHFEDHEQNPWSHIRAALTNSSVVIPLVDGKPALGTWQGIFFCEFDGPRTRRVLVSTLR
ncbi:MAG: secondary thiamine-phosphate synthase enzyme YjbQ [Thermoleophilia bacterium]|nr:secondary thiamine-phosphate synthase enzyme YjbQ [Thermoleophilia bacterium]